MRVSPRLFSIQNPWREAATLMLVAPTQVNGQSTVSYLIMKRSMKSKFMPGGQVFPGGAVSPIDSSPAWNELYEKAGINLYTATFLDKNAQRPTIYIEGADERKSKSLLPQEIALRIAAIRETFEECGILIGKQSGKSAAGLEAGNYTQLKDEVEVRRWQSRLKDNPDEFLTLCRTHSVLPDLSSLAEWSNWLTPTTFTKRRFDTMFFMATVPKPLTAVIDDFEATDAEWSSADELVKKYLNKESSLMPPQFYELSRLRDICKIEDIRKLMDLRLQLGIERWFPHVVNTDDGTLSVLPGDELYPTNPNFFDQQRIDTYHDSSEKQHRMLLGRDIFVTIPPRYGHYYSVPNPNSIKM